MVNAQTGNKVRVHYTGTLDDGSTFDASAQGNPLEITLGKGTTLDGFEKAIVGMAVGEKKTIAVAPEQGYGPHHEGMLIPVERSQLPPELALKIGQQLQHIRSNGHRALLTVVEMNDTRVVLDTNHPLAGKQLHFEIELVEILP
jgi:peptidylprolyl isomerase